MKYFILATVVGCGFWSTPEAQAQYQIQNWLHVAYTYTDFQYREPGVMSEGGQFAGVRGELGFNLLGFLAVSAGGEYHDGHTLYDGSTFGGTPIKQVTNDYFRDLRLMAHLISAPFVLSVGVAERYWYNNLVISYKRRTQYKYNPIQLSYFAQNTYLTLEHDIWNKGTNESSMSDVNPAERDVSFTLGNGTGYAIEAGYFIPSPVAVTKLFLRYQKWSVKASDVQNDGVYDLIEPENNTTLIQAGIGLAF